MQKKKHLQSSALPLSYSSTVKDETRIELMTTRTLLFDFRQS